MSNDEDRLSSTRKALNRISPSFCLAKWMQVNLYLNQGLTASCCQTPPHSIPQSGLARDPSILHNTPQKMHARAEMLAGQRPAECDYCWRMEDIGQISDRIFKSSFSWALPHLAKVLEVGAEQPIDPSYLEVAFDSICNFKCLYCSPKFSSAWGQEIKKFGPYATSLRYNTIEPVEESPTAYAAAFWVWWPKLSRSLQTFRMTGGEPLLIADTWRVLESLREDPRPELKLAINSNLGVGENLIRRLIQSLRALDGKVKRINLYVSMDTHGAQAEYLRHGLDYKQFMHNSDWLLSETTAEVSYMATANALSAARFAEFLADVQAQKRKFPGKTIEVDTSYLRFPSFLSLQILPQSFSRYFSDVEKQMTASGNFGFEEIDNVRRIAHWMTHSRLSPEEVQKQRRDFRVFIEESDRRRATDFLATFPEYAEFWETCT